MSEQNREQGREEQRSRAFNPNEHIIQLKSRQGSQDYLPVQWRLVWFREQCPQGTIDTEELVYDLDREVEAEVYAWNAEKKRSEKIVKKARGYARYRAVITDGRGGRASGTKSENAANFPDFGEKAETGAIGRALAALGYGTQFAPELSEEHRIVDAPIIRSANGELRTPTSGQAEREAPVDRGGPSVESSENGNASGRKSFVTVRPASTGSNGKSGHEATTTSEIAPDAPATEQQLASIHKLCEYLGRPEPENYETLSYASAKELIAQLSQEYRQSRSKAS